MLKTIDIIIEVTEGLNKQFSLNMQALKYKYEQKVKDLIQELIE